MADALDLPQLDFSRDALFLDFDGTLTPIQDDPASCLLPKGMDKRLVALSEKLGGALAILSGRDIRDLSGRVPLNLWRAGTHGLEINAPGEAPASAPESAPELLAVAFRDAVSAHAGAWLEVKGPAFALHFRQCPRAGEELERVANQIITDWPDYRIQPGKMVIEAKPKAACKGLCLEALMQQPPFQGRRPIMIGDDATDEDAMEQALVLGGTAIHIGRGKTCAPHTLPDPKALQGWLESF